MKVIGIDARFYGEAGPGRYTKDIIQHLEKIDKENRYIIFLRDKGFSSYSPTNPNFVKVKAHYTWYSFQEQTRFLAKLLKYRLDLLYVPHFNIPVFYPGKMITAIPDVIMHTFSTEKGTSLPKPYFRMKKFIYKLVFLWAVIRSKNILVPSHAVINDFKNLYPFIPEDKYVLAYEGVDPDLYATETVETEEGVLNKYGIRQPFLLYISSFYEHKNVPTLLDAFKILRDKYGFQGQLVLIGKRDKFAEEIQVSIGKKDLQGGVLMPGMETYVTDQELISLRKAAEIYVFPSLKEGFSLTPMEAQAVGLPCVISDIPVHREIYKDSVEYFDPKDPSAIAEKVNTVLNDVHIKETLKDKGYEMVKNYSWEETAKITLAVILKALSK